MVIPPNIQYGIFTCGAIDNIDRDSSSSTSQSSYHGTSISVFQFPLEPNEHQIFKYSEDFTTETAVLPESYTHILPTKECKPEPTNRRSINNQSDYNNIIDEEIVNLHEDTLTDSTIENWVKKLRNITEMNNFTNKSCFSAFHDNNILDAPKRKQFQRCFL